jgi:hypothetical protein
VKSNNLKQQLWCGVSAIISPSKYGSWISDSVMAVGTMTPPMINPAKITDLISLPHAFKLMRKGTNLHYFVMWGRGCEPYLDIDIAPRTFK